MLEAPKPGDMIADRYRLQRLIGEGLFGVVWQAQDVGESEIEPPLVAVKLLRSELTDDSSRRRFVNEARASTALRSEHVVSIHDVGAHGASAYLTMELLHGETLRERLARGKLTAEHTGNLLTQLGDALTVAHHQQIVHRDLKPGNIFLCLGPGAHPLVKVLDFGFAKLTPALLEVQRETRTGDQLGTPHYMSPEQFRSSKDVDFQADLWAVGVLAFHCLLGQKPFAAKRYGELVLAICRRPPPIPSAMGEVPAGFDAWFAQATARQPEQRFSSCADMVSQLNAVLG